MINAANTTGYRALVGALAVALAAALSLTAGCKKDAAKSDPKTTPEAKPDVPVDKPADKPAGDAAGFAAAAGKYKVDGAHSAVVFRTKHMGVSWAYGMFLKIDGALTLDGDPAKSSVEVTVDTDSVFTANKKRDDHLKANDFFDAKQFPKITFKSTGVRASGEGKVDVTGDLSLHGVTKSVTGTFELVGHKAGEKGKLVGFHGVLDIKRSEFGMKKYLDNVGDETTIFISIEAMGE